MATNPTPRSYNQILGSMIAAFLAKFPIRNLKVGGPILSILEAAAQSDLRNTSETFTLLASTSLDSANGSALDRIMADEGTARLGSTPSTGVITVTDSRYTKLSSVIYPGKPAPLAGTATVYVTDATGWPASGYLYIGRDTLSYEGPLHYTSLVNNVTYWTVNLDPLTRTGVYHNLGESVVVAQGGNRTIGAGTIVQTPQGNTSTAVQFSVLYPVSLPDGEVSVSGVQIVCTQPGTIGNVVAGAIAEFVVPPFTGAVCSNPLPLVNGTEIETDDQGRTRIRNLRQSRTRGTNLAIETYLIGTVSPDENKRISSAKVVDRQGYPTTVYIDDGTGYEEVSTGFPYEILTPSAVGGEEYFQLSLGRPVTKAYVKTQTSEPWNIPDLSTLMVTVGGITYTHTFSASDFRAPTNAAAYEVVHSINADSNIGFSARTSENNTKVVIFAKADSNEAIQVQASTTNDANDVLGFPLNKVETCRLYKNDVLLSKDGAAAAIAGSPQGTWLTMTTPETLTVGVDGTSPVSYSITSTDFVSAGTGYNSLSNSNSLASWAAVLNYKIPGITATVDGDHILLTSNAGPVTRGALAITGGSLVSKFMFPAATVAATPADYTLNRNTGQLHLNTVLSVGDKLTAGTQYTRGFIESVNIPSTVNLAGGKTYWVVDGDPVFISLPLTAGLNFTFTQSVPTVGFNYLILTCTNGTPFTDVAEGDWVVFWDANIPANNRSVWRVSHRASAAEIRVVAPVGTSTSAGFTLAENGITVVRTSAYVQQFTLAASAVYTAQSLSSAIGANIEGAVASVVRTGYVRVTTDTLGANGDITLVAQEAGAVGVFTAGVTHYSNVNHLAYVESANKENSAPTFLVTDETTTESVGSQLTLTNNTLTLDPSMLVTGLDTLPYSLSARSWGNNLGFVSAITSNSTNVYTLRETLIHAACQADRFYMGKPFAIGALDDLSIIMDNNVASKRFEVPLSRKVDNSSGTYGATGMVIKDADNSGAAFGAAFGSSFSFNDYALYMHPRVIVQPGAPDTAVLWRYKQMGDHNVSIQYDYPYVGSASTNWTMDYSGSVAPKLFITLPSSVASTFTNIHSTTRIGVLCNGRTAGGVTVYRWYVMTGVNATTFQVTTNVVTVTCSVPIIGGSTGHGFTTGDQVYIAVDASVPQLASGLYTITGTPTATTFTYGFTTPDGGPWTSTPASWVYADTSTGANFSGLSSNNVFGISPLSTVYSPAKGQGMFIVSTTAGYEALSLNARVGATTDTAVRWSTAISDPTYLQAFTTSTTTANLVSGLPSDAPVTAVSLGAGSVSTPTWLDQNDTTTVGFSLVDGINYVKTTTPAASPSNYTIDLKNAVSVGLASYSQWATEESYLVPITAKNIASYLNTLAVCGLSANGEVEISSRAGKIQISTATAGSIGSVQVSGGLANQAIADVVGSAGNTTGGLSNYLIVPTAQTSGIHPGWMVEIVNSLPIVKSYVNNVNNVNLTSIVGNTWTFATALVAARLLTNYDWQFERWGNYMAMRWTGINSNPLTTVYVPGDTIVISNGGADTLSISNEGQFVILAIDSTNDVIWYENAEGVEERVTATVTFYNQMGIQPGDKMVVGHANWGAANQTTFTIATVDPAGAIFTTVETPAPSGAVAAPQTGTQIVSGMLNKFVQRVTSIAPVASGSTYSALIFGSAGLANVNAINEVYGSQVKALAKLDFPVGTAIGTDGYKYSVGLIGESDRVMYGDESDPISYPGVVAAGSNVNISGPLVRRIQIGLNLRVRGTQSVIFDAVRSAVATFVNNAKVGESIAISDIVAVAAAIGGVDAVSVSSPTYSTSSDLITVQPYEKPLVLQPDTDITLTLAG